MGDLLRDVLTEIDQIYQDRPDLVLAAWPDVIGPRLAPMTKAVSLVEGVLTVSVKNSTLHTLLSRHDKFRLLAAIQKRFPKVNVQNIVFRIA